MEATIHRVTPEGDTGIVENTNPEADNKEFLVGFSTSISSITFLVKDKQNTPTVDGGCASLSVAQSSLVSKYSVANEHSAKNSVVANSVITNEFVSRQ